MGPLHEQIALGEAVYTLLGEILQYMADFLGMVEAVCGLPNMQGALSADWTWVGGG